MNPKVFVPRRRLAEFCRANGISKLAVFGSALREDFGLESDLDVLVTFSSGRTPGLRFFGIAEELSQIFGRSMDLLTHSAVERSLNHIRRKAILESTEVIYSE